MHPGISRRNLLIASGAVLGGTLAPRGGRAATSPASKAQFRFCLNTATIMGQKLPLAQTVELAAKAGYNAIEPWIREIEAHVSGGGKTADLKKRIADLGLSVESSIGFAEWIVDDDARRAKGLEQARRDMDLAAQIGAKRIAAPPAGATNQSDFNLMKAAERYRALAEIGEQVGVTPQIEVWGFSKVISKLGEAAMIGAESGHPKACIVTDVYHMYKGASAFSGIRLMSPQALQVVHLNDYPAQPPREQIRDEHRIYPGDGTAPLDSILRDLAAVNPQCILSIELFNREYWKQEAGLVIKTGLEKMKSAVARSVS